MILMKTQLVMVFGTKFLPLSAIEAACDVAATDEDPGDTDEDSGGDGVCYKVLASLSYRGC